MEITIERNVGETFEFEGRTFVVADSVSECQGCFFEDLDCIINEYNDLGRCCDRQDGKQVIFKEIKPK